VDDGMAGVLGGVSSLTAVRICLWMKLLGVGEWGVKREARISHLSSLLMMRCCLFLVF
jgi:hypothetical protein